jgi:hypothetical protein
MSGNRGIASGIVKGLAGVGAIGVGSLAYAALYEVNAFRLRRVKVPVLPIGAREIRVLHVSDLHMTPADRARQRWLSMLGALEPDLVINTGDNLAHHEAVPFVLGSFGRLLDRPGVYVWGANDYYPPMWKNPLRYFRGPSGSDRRPERTLPWQDLGRGFKEAGWIDLTHTRAGIPRHRRRSYWSRSLRRSRRGDRLGRYRRCHWRHARALSPSARCDGVRRPRFDHGRTYSRRPGMRTVLRSAGHQLRPRDAPRQGPVAAQCQRSHCLAQRFSRCWDLSVRPDPLRMPA